MTVSRWTQLTWFICLHSVRMTVPVRIDQTYSSGRTHSDKDKKNETGVTMRGVTVNRGTSRFYFLGIRIGIGYKGDDFYRTFKKNFVTSLFGPLLFLEFFFLDFYPNFVLILRF